jgi:hypothetical protein
MIRSAVFLLLVCAESSALFINPPCCFPNLLSGKLNFGSDNRPFHFSVDFSQDTICGEFEDGALAFCAAMEPSKHGRSMQMTYILETSSQQCYVIPKPRSRVNGRCTLKETAFYAGSTKVDGRSQMRFALKHPHLAKMLGVEGQGLGEPAFMSVNSGNCLPIQISDANNNQRSVFFDMVEALGSRHGDLISSMTNCQNLIPDVTIPEVFKHIMDVFFPESDQPGQPCCGPLMWQGSVSESYVYTDTNGDPAQVAIFAPQMYFNYESGKIAGNILEWQNGKLIANDTILMVFGDSAMYYVVDWMDDSTCFQFNITDFDWTIKGGNCMLPGSTYLRTVYMEQPSGSSAPIDVWQWKYTDGQFNMTNEKFVTQDGKCETVVDHFNEKIGKFSLSGTAFITNLQRNIVNPAMAFRVPRQCKTAPTYFITTSEMKHYMMSLMGL